MRPAICPAIVCRIGHRAEHPGRFRDGEHDALPALAVGDIGAFDVRGSKQHLAVAPKRERGNERPAIRVGRVELQKVCMTDTGEPGGGARSYGARSTIDTPSSGNASPGSHNAITPGFALMPIVV